VLHCTVNIWFLTVSISIYIKKLICTSFFVICYYSSNLTTTLILYPFFFTPLIFSLFTFLEVGLKFHLLDVIANMLFKSSTFIRSLNMHLYRNNINLKIDIPYSLPLPYLRKITNIDIFSIIVNSEMRW